MPEHKGVIIGNKNMKLCLYERKDSQQKKNAILNHFGINVENFDRKKICLSLGVKILYGGLTEWENSKSLYILDPDGYEIETTEKLGGDVENEIF